MAVIRSEDELTIASIGKNAKCMFCGEREATGWWRAIGSDVISCRLCAVEVLPRLIADSLAGSASRRKAVKPDLIQVNAALETIHKEFWRALWLAVGK